MAKLIEVSVRDIRFPTSRELHGSDAMHKSPDYSAVYVVFKTDSGNDIEGHGLTFTLGRGNELVLKAAQLYAKALIGRTTDEIFGDFGRVWRELARESQIRWLGPEKGAIHLALAAVINALWDLWAKMEDKPLWKLLTDMSPEQLVSVIDFSYLSDVLTKEEAIEKEIITKGYPSYTTSAGWIGYTELQLHELCQKYLKAGWTRFKMKVGSNLDDDMKRAEIFRQEIGWDNFLFKPIWIEEPTSPDDVLGHAEISKKLQPLGIGVASGEHCQNRVIFKQFLQLKGLQFCQIDSCRMVPVCPHGGGVGLCEYIQHISIFDYICVSASLENRVTEFADHLHEHFIHPAVTENGAYKVPMSPGYSAEMKKESLDAYEYPTGSEWQKLISNGQFESKFESSG
ncbi:Mitochondrial enolase superfamily member 1 [Acropora cervicornis]|uniref:Mitochondrial enolase superfamily member 1 n=1 Tax=Acropora cervicornis TaxID=6130 RepID=A0AAD9Q2V4_ACRCE|nr:Mitochondrial enolase superfamily member 1 [Acropora cervicornis]